MWTSNVSITNNTDYVLEMRNSFLGHVTISPNGGSFNWTTSDSPNTSRLGFFIIGNDNPEFQGGLYFGEDCGVWVDRGYMESPSVILNASANDQTYVQESNGGNTILEDYSSGGNISLVFNRKVYTQEFRLG